MALRGWYEDELNDEAPRRRGRPKGTIDLRVRVKVRMSPELRAQLSKLAEQERRDLNAQIVYMLERALALRGAR